MLEAEVAAYQKEHRVYSDPDDPVDPNQWWQVKKKEFHILYQLSRRALCIPATSATSERIFSGAGLTVTEIRNRLASDKVSDLVILRLCCKKVDALLSRGFRMKFVLTFKELEEN